MTKELIVQLRDDLDKQLGETVATRTFSVGGVNYETELSDSNYAKLLDATAPFVQVARPAKKKKKAAAKPKEPDRAHMQDQSVMRQWAREHGHDVPERGSLPAVVRNAYHLAHPGGNGTNV